MPSCREQKANESPEKEETITEPFFPLQKVDAEISGYEAEGVNLVKLRLAVPSAG